MTAVAGPVVAAALYAWWATGLRPFTAPSYASVAIPALALAAVATAPRRAAPRRAGPRRPPGGPGHSRPAGAPGQLGLRATWPWVVLAGLGAALEALGLALGGRSASVPTLSTVVDHALATHPERFVLFGVWLAVGAAPVAGGAARLRRGGRR